MDKIIKINQPGRQDGSKKLHLDAALPPLQIQHVWYEMKQKSEWHSIALVPVTDDISTLGVAHGIGLMAIREPHDAVWVVNASSGDVDHIRPADVNPSARTDRFPYKFVNLGELGITPEKQLFTAERMLEKFAEQQGANMRFIFAVDSIIERTYTIPLCRTVDTVILCLALGMTSFKAVTRTVEIIGRERIMGSIILAPRAA